MERRLIFYALSQSTKKVIPGIRVYMQFLNFWHQEKNPELRQETGHTRLDFKHLLLLFLPLSNHTKKNMWHQRWLQALIIVPLSERRVEAFMVAPFCGLCCSSRWMWMMRSKVQKCNWSSVESFSSPQSVITLKVPAMARWTTSMQRDVWYMCMCVCICGTYSRVSACVSMSLLVVCV